MASAPWTTPTSSSTTRGSYSTNLNTLGWVLIILGVVQLTGGFSLLAGNTYGRVIGIIAGRLGALGALFSIGGTRPWWSLCVFALCVYVVYGIVVYGEDDTARSAETSGRPEGSELMAGSPPRRGLPPPLRAMSDRPYRWAPIAQEVIDLRSDVGLLPKLLRAWPSPTLSRLHRGTGIDSFVDPVAVRSAEQVAVLATRRDLHFYSAGRDLDDDGVVADLLYPPGARWTLAGEEIPGNGAHSEQKWPLTPYKDVAHPAPVARSPLGSQTSSTLPPGHAAGSARPRVFVIGQT